MTTGLHHTPRAEDREHLVEALRRLDSLEWRERGNSLDPEFHAMSRHVEQLGNEIASIPTPQDVQQVERDLEDAQSESQELEQQLGVVETAVQRSKRECERLQGDLARARKQRLVLTTMSSPSWSQFGGIAFDVFQPELRQRGFSVRSGGRIFDDSTHETEVEE